MVDYGSERVNILIFNFLMSSTCTHNRLPEDKPLGLKHVEDIKKLKIKILI